MLISNRKAFVRIQIMDFRANYSLQWLILPAGDLFCDLLECHHLSWYLHGIFAYCQISIPSIQFFLHIADLTLETFCLFFELIRSQRRVSRQSLSHWPSLSCHPLKLAQNFREVVSSHVFSVCCPMKKGDCIRVLKTVIISKSVQRWLMQWVGTWLSGGNVLDYSTPLVWFRWYEVKSCHVGSTGSNIKIWCCYLAGWMLMHTEADT